MVYLYLFKDLYAVYFQKDLRPAHSFDRQHKGAIGHLNMEQKPSTGRERKEFVLIDATAKQISTLGKLLPVLTFLVTEGKRETCHGYLALVL